MTISLKTIYAAALASVVFLAPGVEASKCSCVRPTIRREWRTLSVEKRLAYIDAVKCLMNKAPESSTDDLPGVRSRYDDFVGTHIVQADFAHFVGKFYPYHRLYLHSWEKALNTCGWTDGLPYWDWNRDFGTDEDFFNSPVFDEVTGLGGNGAWVLGNITHPEPGFSINAPWDMPDRTGGSCIQTGPFANLTSSFGPHDNIAFNPQPECVRRDFSPQSFQDITNPDNVEMAMAQVDYGWFSMMTEPTIHAGGHLGVGGLYGHMADKWASPADPIFWLHHGNVDRAWWSWQKRDLKNRVNDISGPIINFDYANEFGGNITLNDVIYIGETVKLETTIREVMHIQRGPLCYDYDELY
ncbi:hypothetical protein B0T11DRAFT_333582 [Plectosphaerella cucumerina]|uniref:Tyrosinase copper-binding domain-containing protein n=1 Tax=Plectosphaerella cucumerina TaxID=40658 RepID=A0A8K0T7A0_9PEZI|nr:hypothetical protein B0T11DRAFT_333582 [Plectosphaerella cucumerina]